MNITTRRIENAQTYSDLTLESRLSVDSNIMFVRLGRLSADLQSGRVLHHTWRLCCILQSGAANEVADPAEVIPAFSADGKTVEVVFSFDTTGSMYGVLAQVNLPD